MSDNASTAIALVAIAETVAGNGFDRTALAFNMATYGDCVAAFAKACRHAETLVENAATVYGRETLRGLLSGDFTPRNVALAAYAQFKPTSPASGKECAPSFVGENVKSVSSLRNAKGGDNARKTLESLFNIEFLCRGDADSKGANKVFPAVQAFIDNAKGAHSSVRTLEKFISEAMKAENERLVPTVATPSEPSEPTEPTEPVSLIAAVAAAIDAYKAASADEKAGAAVAINAFFDMVAGDTIAATAVPATAESIEALAEKFAA